MTAPQTIHNTRDSALVHSEVTRDCGIGLSGAVHSEHFGNVLIGEFPNAGHVDTGFDGMGMVSQAINPFEVGHTVISFDGIDVIDLGQAILVRNESPSNQPMHGGVFVHPCRSHVDAHVSPVVGPEFHLFADPAENSVAFGRRNTVKAPYPASIAYLVEGAEFGDRNGSPFLDNIGGHKAMSPCWIVASLNMAHCAVQLN